MEGNVIRSPWKDVHPQPGETLSSLVLRRAAEHGDKIAFVDSKSGEALTFAGFVTAVRNACNGVIEHGVTKGEVVSLILPNSIHYPVVFHAIIRAGAILTTCNPLYKKDEVLHNIKTSGARFVVTTANLVESIHEMFADEPQLKPKVTFVLGEAPGCVSFSSLMAADNPSWPEVDIKPDDIAALPFSSGTTGLPKAVIQTHRSYVYSTLQLISPEVDFLRHDDVLLAFLPMFHAFGIVTFLKAAIALGRKVVVMERYSVHDFLEAIQNHKVTRVVVVPPVVLHLAKDPLVLEYELSSLNTLICGAAPLSDSLQLQIKKRLPHLKLRNLFGMTEVNVAMLMPEADERLLASGKPVPNTVFKVLDSEHGTPCRTGELGELYVKAPQIFKGYYKDKVATENTISQDGWVKTGDLVWVDEDGFIYVVDRCKELIKYKGFQVPPAELEGLLLKHEGVADAAVIGVSDVECGEIPKAFIVKVVGAKVTEEDILAYVEDNISPQKKVRIVEFVSSIPKSASGKILRKILREEEKQKSLV